MQRQLSILLIVCIFLLHSNETFAQKPAMNFHHLTVRQGLNDGSINAICQDRFGYMWFATFGGINRFDGVSAQKFTHIPGDTTSVKNAVPYSIAAGHDNRLWIGYTDGLMEFDITTGKNKSVKELENKSVYSISRAGNNKLYMTTPNSLVCYDPMKNKTEQLYDTGDTATQNLIAKRRIYDLTIKDDKIYIGTYSGFIIYDIGSRKAKIVELPYLQKAVNRIMRDSEGFFWVSSYNNFSLWRVSADGLKIEVLDSLLTTVSNKALGNAADFREDKQGRIWIITNNNGLLEYDLKTKQTTFHKYNNTASGLSSGILRSMYLSNDGTLWVTSVAGVDYCFPDKNLFAIISPFPEEKESKYARGVIEAHTGNFWFTTGNGISEYDPVRDAYKVWRNEYGKKEMIYYNSVRGIAEDNDHHIWIATGQGVNILGPATGKMRFLTIKDSLPQAFYFSANKFSDGTIWFGTRDYDGFYFYSPIDKKVHSITSHPALKKFAQRGGRYAFQDSKKRIWLGFNGNGLAMYDPSTNTTKEWLSTDDKPEKNIAGNLIVDIKEDKKGVIWVSSFGGITGIDVEHDRYLNFNDKNGLKSNIAGPIAVDAYDRLWIGTAAGLSLLDSSRKYFTHFGIESGLTLAEFPEHPGIYVSNGDIIFPSVSGYIRFDPLKYKEALQPIPFYISSFNLYNKDSSLFTSGTEEGSIRLKPSENFFSIRLNAINYENPTQTWYAYLLEGFDKNWHYTQDPKAVYTNVPGGTYTFRYKATANINNWNVVEKKMDIRIGKFFYKTIWFWIMISILVLYFLYWFYRNRIRHQQQMHLLHNKAQLLEKEKALVMYENLKQHLNPHFLFNSLTSLSSLIRIDQQMAGDFLDKMSKVYRYILKNRDNETVPLGEELKFVQLYIDLQKTRFEDALQVNVTIDEDYYHRKIAPVTLQNLVENAIKHNTADPTSPLKIDLYAEDDYLVVRNNLQKKNFVETSNKQGLTNMESLYHYLSERPMQIIETDQFFIIKIPLI